MPDDLLCQEEGEAMNLYDCGEVVSEMIVDEKDASVLMPCYDANEKIVCPSCGLEFGTEGLNHSSGTWTQNGPREIIRKRFLGPPITELDIYHIPFISIFEKSFKTSLFIKSS